MPSENIKNPFFLIALEKLAIFFDRPIFYFFHFLFRVLILIFFLPLLKIFFFILTFGNARLEVRNSFLRKSDFRFLWSDVDLVFVLKNNDVTKSVNRNYRRCRFIFPLLGEHEVYLESEWELIQDQRAEIDAFEILKALRKFKNQRLILEKKIKYHSAKSKRSVANLEGKWGFLQKNNINKNSCVDFLLKDCPETSSFLVTEQIRFVKLLGYFVGFQKNENTPLPENSIVFKNSRSFLIFLSLFPASETVFVEYKTAFELLRSTNPIKNAFRAVLVKEYLLNLSDIRVGKGNVNEQQEWLRYLEDVLKPLIFEDYGLRAVFSSKFLSKDSIK